MSRKIDVVLVDDSRALLHRHQTLLEELPVHVVGTATTGPEAMRIVEERRPDLVLMDIVMPGMDGIATLRMLKGRFPDLRIALVSSAGGSEARVREGLRLGASQVLVKPVDADQLEALVAEEQARLAAEEGSR